MSREEFVPQIPYGTRDFLPEEARQKRNLENTLAALFSRWGYDEVVTPTFEYLDTLTVGVGGDIQQNIFKFLDKNNRILGLRPDMTAPIARVAATRLKDESWPLRLYYLTNVFRYELAQAGRHCEFYQGGVELLGIPGPIADAETIALAVETLLAAGLREFQISLGQVQFINGIMDEFEFEPGQRQRLKQCMVTRNLVGLAEAAAEGGLSENTRRLIKDIPLLHGKQEILEGAYRRAANETSRQALDNLAEIYQALKSYGVEEYVNFDLGLIRDFEYYTGMVFEGYTPGLGFPVCGGGRYDTMLAQFGLDYPATGFALGIERLLLAMQRQGITSAENRQAVYVGWRDTMLSQAISLAKELRASGVSVEMALKPETEAQAEEARLRKGCGELRYIG